MLRDAQGLPSELWVPRKNGFEPMPTRHESPYSFLTDSMPSNQDDAGEAAPLSQATTSDSSRAAPLSAQLGVPGPCSSGAAAGAESPSQPALPAGSAGNVVLRCEDDDEDEPPADLLEPEEGQEKDEEDGGGGSRDEMTKMALELRRVDLASLRSEKSTGSKKRGC